MRSSVVTMSMLKGLLKKTKKQKNVTHLDPVNNTDTDNTTPRIQIDPDSFRRVQEAAMIDE